MSIEENIVKKFMQYYDKNNEEDIKFTIEEAMYIAEYNQDKLYVSELIESAIKVLAEEIKRQHQEIQDIYVDMRINGSNYYADKLNKAMKGRLKWDKDNKN